MIVEIGADAGSFNKAVSAMDKQIQKAGDQIVSFGEGLTKGLSLPIIAAGGALAAAGLRVGTFADELLDLVDQTGLTSATLQEFRHVALKAGVESDVLATAAIKLTTGLSGTGDESKNLAGALGALGLSARDSTGLILPMDTLLPGIITKLQGMDDITTRNTLAADIFGRSWSELAPVLSMGAAEMEGARNEARELGLVLGDDALASADQFRKEMETLKSSFGALTNEVGSAVLPILQALVGIVQQNAIPAIRKMVEWFDDWSPAMKKTVAVVAVLVAGVGPLIVAIGTMIKLIPQLTLAMTKLGGATGIGLVIAGVAALTYAWSEWGYGIQKIVGGAMRFVKEILLDGFVKIVRGVIDFALGPLDEAFAWLWEKIGKEYAPGILDSIKTNFDKLDAWMSWPAEEATTAVGESFDGMATTTIAAVTEMSEEYKARFDAMTEATDKAAIAMVGISTTVDSYLTPAGKAAYDASKKLREDFEALGGTLEKVTAPIRDTSKAMGQDDGLTGTIGRLAKAVTGDGGIINAFGDFANEITGAKYTSSINSVVKSLVGDDGIGGSLVALGNKLTGGDLFGALDGFIGKLTGKEGLVVHILKVVDTIQNLWKVIQDVINLINKFNSTGVSGGGPPGGSPFIPAGPGGRIPFPSSFADGGSHDGGLRLVGERGPEIEATGPSRIYSNSQTKDLLGGASDAMVRVSQAGFQALIKEMQLLRGDVYDLRRDVRLSAGVA